MNPLFPALKHKEALEIRKLKLKKYRDLNSLFVVEGIKCVRELLGSSYQVQKVVCTHLFLEKNPDFFNKYKVPPLLCTRKTFQGLSALTTHQEVLALASIQKDKPPDLLPGQRVLMLDHIRDPGNMGTLIRIADWYGIKQIICAPTTVDQYNPKVIQASMGSFVRVKICYTPLLEYLKKKKMPAIGAVLGGHHYVGSTLLPKEGILVIGNEAHGISEELLPFLEIKVTIKRYGAAESLNAGVAAAIICQNWMN